MLRNITKECLRELGPSPKSCAKIFVWLSGCQGVICQGCAASPVSSLVSVRIQCLIEDLQFVHHQISDESLSSTWACCCWAGGWVASRVTWQYGGGGSWTSQSYVKIIGLIVNSLHIIYHQLKPTWNLSLDGWESTVHVGDCWCHGGDLGGHGGLLSGGAGDGGGARDLLGQGGDLCRLREFRGVGDDCREDKLLNY